MQLVKIKNKSPIKIELCMHDGEHVTLAPWKKGGTEHISGEVSFTNIPDDYKKLKSLVIEEV
jgi:hypothetical protein